MRFEKRVFLALFAVLSSACWFAPSSVGGPANSSAIVDINMSHIKSGEQSSDNSFSTLDFLSPADKKEIASVRRNAQANDSRILLKVFVNVPHNSDPANEFTLFPYPMNPPPMKNKIKPLPNKVEYGLRNLILTSGYNSRTSKEKAYPFSGWRWQYAFQAALRKSGLGVPHIITEMYSWADEMIPYVIPEVKRLNDAERERTQHFLRAKQDYMENRADAELEATQRGAYPTDVKMATFDDREMRTGTAKVIPGKWWLCGTHKVPGLIYYWCQAIEVEPGVSPQTVELTEGNALEILGGW